MIRTDRVALLAVALVIVACQSSWAQPPATELDADKASIYTLVMREQFSGWTVVYRDHDVRPVVLAFARSSCGDAGRVGGFRYRCDADGPMTRSA